MMSSPRSGDAEPTRGEVPLGGETWADAPRDRTRPRTVLGEGSHPADAYDDDVVFDDKPLGTTKLVSHASKIGDVDRTPGEIREPVSAGIGPLSYPAAGLIVAVALLIAVYILVQLL